MCTTVGSTSTPISYTTYTIITDLHVHVFTSDVDLALSNSGTVCIISNFCLHFN